jgi:hypothetical protein
MQSVDHHDFTADGRILLASCEFNTELSKVDDRKQRPAGVLQSGSWSPPAGWPAFPPRGLRDPSPPARPTIGRAGEQGRSSRRS